MYLVDFMMGDIGMHKLRVFILTLLVSLSLSACGRADISETLESAGSTDTRPAAEATADTGAVTEAADTSAVTEAATDTSPAAEATTEVSGPSDADFISNLGKGLEARWALVHSDKYSEEILEDMSKKDYQKAYDLFVDAEYDVIGSIDSYHFKDEKIKALAETYMKGLDLQKKGVKFQGTSNYVKYGKTWDLGYSYRAVAAADLCKGYGLKVDKKYKTDLDELVKDSDSANTQIEKQEFAKGLQSSLSYTKDEKKSDDSTDCYKAVVENTTEASLDCLEINVKFLDESGEVLDKVTDYIYDLKPGEKAKSKIKYDRSSGEYASMKISAISY